MDRDAWRHTTQFLAPCELRDLCRVSRAFRRLFSPWLYQHTIKPIYAVLACAGLNAAKPWPVGLGLCGLAIKEAVCHGRDDGHVILYARFRFTLAVPYGAQARVAGAQQWLQQRGWELAAVFDDCASFAVTHTIHFLPRERLTAISAKCLAGGMAYVVQEYELRKYANAGLNIPAGTLLITNGVALKGSVVLELFVHHALHMHECGAAVMHSLPHFNGRRVCFEH